MSKELHIQGWLCLDSDGLLSTKVSRDKPCAPHIIQEDIERAQLGQFDGYEDENLGGKRVFLPNVSMRIYVTNKKCTLEEAAGALISHLYGDVTSDIGYEGYSEWTITNYYFKEFKIGGHDLHKELSDYVGKYIHLVIERVELAQTSANGTREERVTMNFSDLEKCPFCDGDEFYYIQTASGQIYFAERFDGKETNNENMYDMVDATGGEWCRCRRCDSYLGNRKRNTISKKAEKAIADREKLLRFFDQNRKEN